MNERLYESLVLPDTDLSIANHILLYICERTAVDAQASASFIGTVGEALHHLQKSAEGYFDIGLQTTDFPSIRVRSIALNPDLWNPSSALSNHRERVTVEIEKQILLVCSIPYNREQPPTNEELTQWRQDIQQMDERISNSEKSEQLDHLSSENTTDSGNSFTKSTCALLRELSAKDQTLIQARDQLEEDSQSFDQSNRMRSQLVRQISHDLRTPLHAISGSINLLQKTDLSPKQQEYLNVFEKATETMTHLVNNILDLSRIRSGTLELQEKPVSIKQFLDNNLSYLMNLAEDNDIELRTDIAPDVPDVLWVDPDRLNQILSNLVSNAITHTDEAGSISVHLDRLSDHEDHVLTVWEVTDTGPGIPENQQQEIFDPFVQKSNDTSEKGFGLGLTIAKQLVQQMNGRIEVQSEPGEGSTFRCEIPLKRPSIDDLEDEDQVESTLDSHSLDDKRILVADEDPATLLHLQELLTTRGASVKTLDSAGAINDYFQPFSDYKPDFDAIFLNPHLSGLNGLELLDMLNHIRSMEKVVPIASEQYEKKNRQHAARFGVKHLLTKPIDHTQFQEVVDTLFQPTTEDDSDQDQDTPPPLSAQNTPIRMLLAEDNQINRTFMRRLLDSHPIDLTCVENGRKAVEQFRNDGFDLILMDLKMPELDGIDAVREIREFEQEHSQKRTPILALTAETRLTGDRKKRLNTDFEGHLSKPVGVEEILHAIRVQLDETPS